MKVFVCPSVDPPKVELTDERQNHIARRHPDLVPEHIDAIEETIRNPDGIRPNEFSADKSAFFKWFPNLRGGKFVIVQVLTEWGADAQGETRYWIVTAYLDSVPPY